MMPKLSTRLIALFILLAFLVGDSAFIIAETKVKGYYRKDGTYVRPHTRSSRGSSSYTPSPVYSPVKPSPKEEESTSGEVFITKTGSKYHRASCRHLSKSSIPISLEEASSRYSPCSNCSPPTFEGTTQARFAVRTTARTSARTTARESDSESSGVRQAFAESAENGRGVSNTAELKAEVDRLKAELEKTKADQQTESEAKLAKEKRRTDADEIRAAARLRMAEDYLKRPEFKNQAIVTLKSIIKDLPDTRAAAEARSVLNEMDQ